jgi:hypothetical protein
MRGARRRASSPNHRLRTSLAFSLGLHLLLGAVILERASQLRSDGGARQAPEPVLRLRLLPPPSPSRQPEQGARAPAFARAPAGAAPRARAPAVNKPAASEHAAKAQAGATAAGRSAAPEQAASRPVAPAPPAGIDTRAAVDAAVADPRWQLRQRDFSPRPDAMSRAVAGSARPPCYGLSAPIRPGGLLAIPGLVYDMVEGNCSR